MTTPPLPLSIAEILDQPAMVPLWPTVGRALGISASTTYQLAAEDRMPFEVVRLGRRLSVRHVDLLAYLHLRENSEADAAATATASDEHSNESTAKKTGEHS
ncbi:helix-turn-helix domain-containing protein [Streptomyces sp. GMY02]|uniref:helix-turn-helix domain-containing protein n=1 Tax=Streptomyces sp. GMY02 TaxID=1333528 RepID=UPI001C2C9287|nr:helix-turn-helix domain-containing protein [Streptomyces sp. GMY02]QXE36177.1 helix-turn-helix domain-containing protein [Streptomyces sp. GMY02]